jgi:hypothetical protein
MIDTNDTKIKVVDAICGAGKTSWAIQEMNANKDKKYIYITPFLKEIDRIMASTDSNFSKPENKGKGNGKLVGFEKLISYQCNVVATHALFQDFNVNKKEILSKGKYTLILDEVMDVIETVDDIKSGDIAILLTEGIITTDENNYVKWLKNYENTKYDKIKRMAESNSLVLVNDHLMVWNFPVEIFDCFNEVYILTYKFDGQIMRHYYDYHNVKYTKYSVIQTVNSKNNSIYELADYSKENEFEYIQKYRDLINIYEYDNKSKKKDLNKIANKENVLSVTWFKRRATKEQKTELKNNIYNYFTNIINGEAYYNMWTTFTKFENKLHGKGYTECTLRDEYGEPLKDDKGDKEKKQKCFVSFNARATNDYRFKKNLAYICNVFIHPDVEKFFHLKGIGFNKEEYALSELIQWLFRSQIRDGKPINIYIPSSRMRKLLVDWLNSAENIPVNYNVG